jgi:hypothetical protein
MLTLAELHGVIYQSVNIALHLNNYVEYQSTPELSFVGISVLMSLNNLWNYQVTLVSKVIEVTGLGGL